MKTLLVIFGITGDLSTRKLLPALSHIIRERPELKLDVLGVSRRQVDVNQLVQAASGSAQLAARTGVLTIDIANPQQYEMLKQRIAEYEADQTLIYLSVPPGAAASIVDFLGEAGINTPNIHLLFEKPFGFDTNSAKEFIERTNRYFNESQLYRIDHYMAKEVAAEIIRYKLETAETARSVKSVDIYATETVGIEGRAVFYEQTGALRDFIQGHLMQLLSLVLMDIHPSVFALKNLPEYRLKALSMLMPANPASATRAQYVGYQQEALNPGSRVETFVSMQLKSSDPAWENVPLTLLTGKAMNRKKTCICITYSDGTKIELDEGQIVSSDARIPDAYERVLIGAIHAERQLFTTSAEIIHAWEIVAPLQKAWEMEISSLTTYAKGSGSQQITQHIA